MFIIRHIMVAVSADSHSAYVTKCAISLAQMLNAKLTIIFVVNRYLIDELTKTGILASDEAKTFERDMEEEGKQFLARFKHIAENEKVSCETILAHGVVHQRIIEAIKKLMVDLLVIGDMRDLYSSRGVFYDEGERILREAACPVLVIKLPAQT